MNTEVFGMFDKKGNLVYVYLTKELAEMAESLSSFLYGTSFVIKNLTLTDSSSAGGRQRKTKENNMKKVAKPSKAPVKPVKAPKKK